MLNITYDNANLPEDYSVHKREMQLFIKSLRERIYPAQIRFFAVGEYGEQTLRPHYHALIFNFRPPDLIQYKITKSNNIVYKSSFIDSIWQKGETLIGSVTPQSANYVAQYSMKKQNGDNHQTAAYYNRQHPINGLWHQVEPEFMLCSRRPGIGSTWFDKFKSDCFPSDFLTGPDGNILPVPPYYSRKLDREDRVTKRILGARKKKQVADRHNQTPERLRVREEVLKARIKVKDSQREL